MEISTAKQLEALDFIIKKNKNGFNKNYSLKMQQIEQLKKEVEYLKKVNNNAESNI